jgi:hypothetical protein
MLMAEVDIMEVDITAVIMVVAIIEDRAGLGESGSALDGVGVH